MYTLYNTKKNNRGDINFNDNSKIILYIHYFILFLFNH